MPELTDTSASNTQTTGLPPVRLHKIPGWFRAAAYAAKRSGRWNAGSPGLMTTWQLLDAAHASDYGLFDHWGKTAADELVTEPYQRPDDPKFLARVERFAELLNLEYRVQAESEWCPPHTCRVTFWRKGEDSSPVAGNVRHGAQIETAANVHNCGQSVFQGIQADAGETSPIGDKVSEFSDIGSVSRGTQPQAASAVLNSIQNVPRGGQSEAAAMCPIGHKMSTAVDTETVNHGLQSVRHVAQNVSRGRQNAAAGNVENSQQITPTFAPEVAQ